MVQSAGLVAGLVGLLLNATILWFVHRPAATEFFARRTSATDPEAEVETDRVVREPDRRDG